ncbi:MAG: hypothetical protein ACJ76H_12725 [Bacteriovoracaceae bacterium]
MHTLLTATILFIGDSHSVGPFGQKLDELLRNDGARVATYASCGSIARWWFTGQKTTCGYFEKTLEGKVTQATTAVTPIFTQLLNDVHPDHVIIEFGTNYVKEESDEVAIKDMTKLKEEIIRSGADCFWVLPPDMRKFRDDIPRLDRLVKTAIGETCRYFESASVTHYPATGGDGIHYWSPEGTPLARQWAKDAFTAFTAR